MRKSFRKALALGLVATMGVTMLAGCQSKKEESGKEGKVELTMQLWGEPQKKVMNKMIEAYEKKTPNVTVKTQITTWNEYWTKLEAGMSGDNASDIVWMNVLHVEEYAEAGMLKDISEVGKKLEIDKHFPEALVDGYTVDEKLYAIPKDFDTNAIFYNKELFDKAGVPYPTDDFTMEDYLNTCEALGKADLGEGIYPTAINYNTIQTTYGGSVHANGGYFYNDDFTKTGYSDPKTEEAIQPWYQILEKGYSPNIQQMADTTPDAMFEGGKLAMYMAGNYMIATFIQNESIADKFDVAQRPSFNGKKTDIINGLGFSVYAGTKHEKESMEFIEWLGSKEAMDIQGQGGVAIPARNESQKLYLDTHKNLKLEVFLANLEDTHILPHCRVQSEITVFVNDNLQKAWSGETTLTEALANIDAGTPAILEKMK